MLIYIVLFVCFVASAVLFGKTLWTLKRYVYRPVEPLARNMPSVSVCIAARNEMHALAQSLERVLRSDYPKIEVLVLDDSSNDDTSLIIKSFANAGVRFIAGEPVPDGWLGKNHAYRTLAREASGEYILFIDVDTILGVTSISQLLAQQVGNSKSMLSILPQRSNGHKNSAIFGTLRYYWELVLSSTWRPPSASALWMIKRSTILEMEADFSNFGMSPKPELHLASRLQQKGEYQFIVGSPSLGVQFEKRLSSQRETARRLYYPMIGRSLSGWLSASLFIVALYVPFVLVFTVQNIFVQYSAIIILLITTMSMYQYFRRTSGAASTRLRALLWPLLMACELYLLMMSYVAYATGAVTWKGRPVHANGTKHDAFRINE